MIESNLNEKNHVYIGTYTNHNDNGVYHAEYENGTLYNLKQYIKVQNPSYLTLMKEKNILYTVSERGDGADVYAVYNQKVINSLLNIPGRGLCHISLSPNGKYLFGACYDSGHIYSISIDENGGFDKLISAFDHNEYNEIRKTKARAHCIKATPDGKYVIVVDLGLDALIVYSLNNNGELNYKSHLTLKEGTGPRHICFNKNNPSIVYLITEYSNELYTFIFDGNAGTLKYLNNVSSLPDGFKSKSAGAAVKVSPNGEYVAVSNRIERESGAISVFKIDKDNLPSQKRIVNSNGCFPRDFEFTPDSNYIIAANQIACNLSVISLESEKVNVYTVNGPTCVNII